MYKYLFTCRSLTYAQRTEKLLNRKGLKAAVIRTPQQLSLRGCGYAVRLIRGPVDLAINILQINGLMPEKTYLENGAGEYKEVTSFDIP